MRLLIWVVSLITMAAAGIMLGAGQAPATAGTMTVVNSASYQDGPLPRGSLLTIYTTQRVSPEEYHQYPWVPETDHGLWVEASCANENSFRTLPILYNGWDVWGSGNQINVYYPNSIGTEPFGTCANSGNSTIRVHPAGGGAAVTGGVVMLPAHPGIFMANGGDESPAGIHVSGGATTDLFRCRTLLLTDVKACPVRTGTAPADIQVFLTGAEWFTCNEPCTTNDLVFELATKIDAPDDQWVRQDLVSLETVSTGMERAKIKLKSNTGAGKYYLRVRNTFRTEFPTPLRVDFGQPA